jgi:hypothetical protein
VRLDVVSGGGGSFGVVKVRDTVSAWPTRFRIPLAVNRYADE